MPQKTVFTSEVQAILIGGFIGLVLGLLVEGPLVAVAVGGKGGDVYVQAEPKPTPTVQGVIVGAGGMIYKDYAVGAGGGAGSKGGTGAKP